MITYLKMTNWRAYDEREIHFQKGITFLMGANGSGKTSILEAISYALTGEAALFKAGERPQLLRDPQKPGSVTLQIEISNIEYQIQRFQTSERAGAAFILRLHDKKVLADTHSGVTKQVEKLLNISDDFLRRIVYMAEGDVFHFLNAPPKDALDTQVRSVLGLTQLDEFSEALHASEKYFKGRLKILQDLNADLMRLQIRSLSDLEGKLSAGGAAKEKFLDQLDTIGHELGALEQSASTVRNFQEELETLNTAVQNTPEQWEKFSVSPVLNYFDRLQKQTHDVENHHSEIMLLLARLDGQEEAYLRILSLLEPHEDNNDTVPCPVCRKPITQPERKDILAEIRQDVAKLHQEHETQIERKNQISKSSQTLQTQINQLQSLRNLLAHTQLPGIQPTQSFDELFRSISYLAQSQSGEHQTELGQQRDMIRQRLTELENHQAEFHAVKKRLQDFNYKAPEELEDEIISIEVRMLSLRAASQATEDTLQSEQTNDMREIYEQIANLWSSFRDEEGWEVKTNSDGYPVITNQKKQLKLDLRQLSGGEKTALLIMLHTIIAHHFSQSDFLMIDEPLEHLDPVNRRSLIKFLVDAYHHQIFGQAIIATFEESLIRKYHSNEGVNVVLV